MQRVLHPFLSCRNFIPVDGGRMFDNSAETHYFCHSARFDSLISAKRIG